MSPNQSGYTSRRTSGASALSRSGGATSRVTGRTAGSDEEDEEESTGSGDEVQNTLLSSPGSRRNGRAGGSNANDSGRKNGSGQLFAPASEENEVNGHLDNESDNEPGGYEDDIPGFDGGDDYPQDQYDGEDQAKEQEGELEQDHSAGTSKQAAPGPKKPAPKGRKSITEAAQRKRRSYYDDPDGKATPTCRIPFSH